MTVKEFKVYLEVETMNRLKAKAQALGFDGRGAISHFLNKISNESLVFLDKNLQDFARILNVQIGKK